MSLAVGILQIVEEAARGQDPPETGSANKVSRVRLEIGQLASVEVEALRFCFDAVTRGTRAEGAVLEVLSVPGVAFCLRCAGPVGLSALGEPCPDCQGYELQITGGTEMRVKDIEVD